MKQEKKKFVGGYVRSGTIARLDLLAAAYGLSRSRMLEAVINHNLFEKTDDELEQVCFEMILFDLKNKWRRERLFLYDKSETKLWQQFKTRETKLLKKKNISEKIIEKLWQKIQ